jgi:hypothetical protein
LLHIVDDYIEVEQSDEAEVLEERPCPRQQYEAWFRPLLMSISVDASPLLFAGTSGNDEPEVTYWKPLREQLGLFFLAPPAREMHVGLTLFPAKARRAPTPTTPLAPVPSHCPASPCSISWTLSRARSRSPLPRSALQRTPTRVPSTSAPRRCRPQLQEQLPPCVPPEGSEQIWCES